MNLFILNARPFGIYIYHVGFIYLSIYSWFMFVRLWLYQKQQNIISSLSFDMKIHAAVAIILET